MTHINKLEEIAARLNKESDSINETIKDFQDRINKLNLGLEVWLEYDPLHIEYTDEGRAENDTELEYRFRDEIWLGYGKIGDKWGLIVRSAYVKESGPQGYEQYATLRLAKPDFLIKQSRELRIEALDKIEKLTNILARKAAKAIETIQEAKKIAEAVSGESEPEVPKNQKALSGAFPPAIGPIEEKPKAMGRALTSETVMREAGKLKQKAIDPVKALDFSDEKTKKQ